MEQKTSQGPLMFINTIDKYQDCNSCNQEIYDSRYSKQINNLVFNKLRRIVKMSQKGHKIKCEAMLIGHHSLTIYPYDIKDELVLCKVYQDGIDYLNLQDMPIYAYQIKEVNIIY